MQAGAKAKGAAPLPGSGRSSRPRPFRALQHRDFRLLWTGLAVSAVGTWMQIVALSLLVLQLTHGSAIALGALSLVQAGSFLLLAFVGGSVADRFDKRRLLLFTQSLMMGFALLLGVLTAAGAIRFWIILSIAFGSSAALSFDQPSRNALIASLVPQEELMNAVSLQSAVFNGASVLGPALAGLTLTRIGYAGNFFLNAASFLAVLAALFCLRSAVTHGTAKPRLRLLDSVKEAIQYIRKDAVLPSVVSAYGALLFFGPSAALALPLFVKEVLRAGPTQLGMLFSAIGAGTVVGALIIASLGDTTHKARLVYGSILVWMAALAVFGLSESVRVSLPALFVMGASQNAAGATTITLLQTRVPPDMRGRAMSLNTLLIMCIRPLGDFPAGAAMDRLGFRPAILAGAPLVGLVLVALLARPQAASDSKQRGN
jgi:predicted MFS family arabinose efflux permease